MIIIELCIGIVLFLVGTVVGRGLQFAIYQDRNDAVRIDNLRYDKLSLEKRVAELEAQIAKNGRRFKALQDDNVEMREALEYLELEKITDDCQTCGTPWICEADCAGAARQVLNRLRKQV